MITTRVGIVAPSSKVPAVELEMGLQRLRASGFDPVVHPHTLLGHLFFAGTDAQRAQALWQMACEPKLRVIWTARGGYGSFRLLGLLDQYAKKQRKKPPRKLLVGYSDSTVLHEYVRERWGWHTLHAPMPGLKQFCALPENDWQPLVAMIQGEHASPVWEDTRLSFLGDPPERPVSAPLVGGNLSLWASLVGTRYASKARGKIVFFEDTDENLYRVDRLLQQILASGALDGAKAVVLGNFLNCRDTVPQVLRAMPADAAARARVLSAPEPAELEPLRPVMEANQALAEIFADVRRKLGIPVAMGLPVGHGPGKAPLPLGARYELTPAGELRLLKWGWKG